MSFSNETTNYVELTKHTLLVAHTKNQRVELVRECSLADKFAVEATLSVLQPDWKILGIRAATALAPLPTYWHRASSAEASVHRTEDALRVFGANLPYGLSGPLELTACHAGDGTLLTPDGQARWLLGVTSESSLALAQTTAAECRITPIRTESVTLNHIGAIASALRLADEGTVVLWDLGADRSHLFLITSRGVQAVIPCAVGLEDIFTAVQNALELPSRSAAARLFYHPAYDFSAVAQKVAHHIAAAFQTARASLPASGTPPLLACTGLTSSQAWFVRATAQATGLQPWSPDVPQLCSHFKVRFASPEIESGLTPSSLGLLHQIASQQQGNTDWHPTWSRAGITKFATATPFFPPPHAVAPSSGAEPATSTTSTPWTGAGTRSPFRAKPKLHVTAAPPPVAAVKPVLSRPPLAPKMPEKTVARLHDEAFAHLSREWLMASLNKLELDKRRITGTRPPFGVFGTKKAVEAYEASLRSAQDAEINFRVQLKELEPIEHWIQSSLQDLLHDYLDVVDAKYHDYSEISLCVERWQNYVGSLHELSMGFAREARVTAALIEKSGEAESQELKEAIANLRSVSTHLHAQTLQIEMAAKEIALLGAADNLPVAMPELPSFQPGIWVDRVTVLRRVDCVRELKRQEEIARAFFNGGKHDLLLRAESVRSASLRARLEYLNKYWADLRPRALEQAGTPADLEKTFADLKRSYVDSDLRRRKEDETNSPFSLAR